MEAAVTFERGQYSPLVLAYLGDSYFETIARSYLVGDGNCKTAALNEASRQFVTAASQSRMIERILPVLTDEELAIYKSGRNAKSAHRSRSATAAEYHRATGLECLYGYFWISKQYSRAQELFLLGVESETPC